MNSDTYKIFVIKSKLLSKLTIIYNYVIDNNYYYIRNLKDFLEYNINNNNACNITNNNLLNNFKNNINNWNLNNTNLKSNIYQDFSDLIYNYDTTDNAMYDILVKLNDIII
jgi:hypothetical protein